MSGISAIAKRSDQVLLDELTTFCLRHGGTCFDMWPMEIVRDYLRFHCRQQTLAFVRMYGVPTALGIAWQCRTQDLLAAAARGEQFFKWQTTDPGGDALFLADFITLDRGALGAVLRRLEKTFPNWRGLKLYTYRRRRKRTVLKQYSVPVLERMMKGVL